MFLERLESLDGFDGFCALFVGSCARESDRITRRQSSVLRSRQASFYGLFSTAYELEVEILHDKLHSCGFLFGRFVTKKRNLYSMREGQRSVEYVERGTCYLHVSLFHLVFFYSKCTHDDVFRQRPANLSVWQEITNYSV